MNISICNPQHVFYLLLDKVFDILSRRHGRTEEPGRLRSMELHRVRHDLADKQQQWFLIQVQKDNRDTLGFNVDGINFQILYVNYFYCGYP